VDSRPEADDAMSLQLTKASGGNVIRHDAAGADEAAIPDGDSFEHRPISTEHL
jgi:hypothetical protein